MKIETVRGAIESSELGYMLIHEHAVTCCDWSMRKGLGKQFCDEERLLEMAVIQLKKAKAAGIDTIVDGTPINLGMDRFGTVTGTPGTKLENRVETIIRLCRDGWEDKLLVSHDYAPYTGFAPSWKKASSDEALENPVDFTYFTKFAAPMLLERGLTESQLHKLTRENPRNYFEQAFG